MKSKLPPLLISTDFDGTIAPPLGEQPIFAPAFFEWIQKARQKREVQWMINTGRDWTGLAAQLQLRKPPFWPDWVVTLERYIFRIEKQRLFPLEKWNKRCEKLHQQLFEQSDPLFKAIQKKLNHLEDLQFVVDPGSPLGFIANSEEQGNQVNELITPLLRKCPELIVIRNSIYFRFAHKDFNKGTCLGAVLEHLGYTPENCFAVGDHFNDLDMLQPRYCAFTACPSNAIEEVKKQVKEQKGYVAHRPIDAGVVEALEHFSKEWNRSES